MRLIWNAGAALVITGMLTSVASLGSDHKVPAKVGTSVKQRPNLPHRHYSGLSEHFQAANTSGDGRLTLTQAVQAGWVRVATHFGDIDTDHLGFVTQDQIHAYNMSSRHTRKAVGDV